MQLTEKSKEIFELVKSANDSMSVPQLAEATGRNTRSIHASVRDLTTKGLLSKEKVEMPAEGEEKAKEVTFVSLTAEGQNYTGQEEE